jgi:hypothetical protein
MINEHSNTMEKDNSTVNIMPSVGSEVEELGLCPVIYGDLKLCS